MNALVAILVFVSCAALAVAEQKNLRVASYSNSTDKTMCTVYQGATCNSNGVTGVCTSRSSNCCTGSYNPANLCPGNDDIQCCYNQKCYATNGAGTCMQTSLCYSQGGVPDSGNFCDGPADLQCCVKGGNPDGRITRKEMIDRAQDWVNRRIPYSQTATTDGYRQDCSGMVSMAWKSSTAGGGHTTYNMQDICTRIDRSQMQAGDAILRPDEHVLLFHSWVDNDRFYEYAEHDYGTVASHDVTSYSYWANQGFFPCRYKFVA